MMPSREAVLKIPYGTRDFLPMEAAEKRRIENDLAVLFASWGYAEIITPTLEYLDTLTVGSGERLKSHMFKLFDRDNCTIALRHEMTTPIARLVASRLKEAIMPLRLSYTSSIFRYEKTQAGRQCEFFQAGVELMGSNSTAADAEVIALAIFALKKAGLADFTVCLGQVNYLLAVIEELGLDEGARQEIIAVLEKHDLVGLEKLAADLSLTEKAESLLCSLPLLHGGREILAKAREITDSPAAKAAIGNLEEIYDRLAAYGLDEHIVFDLGVIRDFGYYTGMVFEAYAPGLGFPLVGGGRYDNLLADFGRACPATGFALGIDRLMLAMQRQGEELFPVKCNYYISYSAGKEKKAIAEAKIKRAEGATAILALQAETKGEAAVSRLNLQADELIYIE